MIVLTLPREIQSGNTLAYRHWRVRMQDKAAWTMLLRGALTPPRRSAPPPFARVSITAYRKRLLDDDNLIAGAKHLRDALIHAGLIADDDRAHAAFTYEQHTLATSPTGKPCTVVTVTPCAQESAP